MRQLAREQFGEAPSSAMAIERERQHRERLASRAARRPLLAVILATLMLAVVAAGMVAVPRLTTRAPSPAGGANAAPTAQVRAFTDFAIPTANAKPFDITLAPDGNLWFTEFDGNKIGRITPSGVVTEYPVPTPGAAPYLITAAPDGTIWFTEYYGNKIGSVSPSGTVTEVALPDPNSSPAGITATGDDSVWVTAYPGEVDQVVPGGGGIRQFTLPGSTSLPLAIAHGPDGNLWLTYDAEYTRQNPNRISRFSADGTVTDFALPTSFSNVDAISAGQMATSGSPTTPTTWSASSRRPASYASSPTPARTTR